MNTVLSLLKKRPKAGISAKDFPVGYRLSSSIYKLRLRGYNIETQQASRSSLARYVLNAD